MSEAEAETAQPSSSRDTVASAITARLAASARDISAEAQERANQEEKRKLRRIIYSGIERNNDAKLALESTKVLQKLIKNILDHPDEEKYRQFKTTNSTIQRTLIAPKNTLEYAISVGFRADVKNFQPFYVLNPTPKNIQSLKNGLECLDEYVNREEAKAANSKSRKETLQEAQERQRALVKLAYDDDRREKQMRDEMERQRREAVAEVRARATVNPPAEREEAAAEDGDSDAPPPYPMPGGPPVSILPLRGGNGTATTAPANSTTVHAAEEDHDMDDDSDGDGDKDSDDSE